MCYRGLEAVGVVAAVFAALTVVPFLVEGAIAIATSQISPSRWLAGPQTGPTPSWSSIQTFANVVGQFFLLLWDKNLVRKWWHHDRGKISAGFADMAPDALA